MRQHHDMGGLAAGAIEQQEHDHEPWEKQVDAVMRLLSGEDHQLITVDELRRCIEGLGADVYDRLSYYERWLVAISQLLIEKGIINVDELGRKIAAIQAQHGDVS